MIAIQVIFIIQRAYYTKDQTVQHKKIQNVIHAKDQVNTIGRKNIQMIPKESLQIPKNKPDIMGEQVIIEHSTTTNEISSIEFKEILNTFLNSKEITSQGEHLEWVVAKIRSDMEEWVVTHKLVLQKGWIKTIKKKNILLLMGLLFIDMGRAALRGGPVGELVQWSTLMVGLNMFGHHIEIAKNGAELEQKLSGGHPYDLIFIDYLGLSSISEERYFQYRCKFRVLDNFGTDPQFNMRTNEISGIRLYDRWNLPDTRQIWTYLPLTQDNSFLGIIIPFRNNQKSTRSKPVDSKKIALVYGKSESYLHYDPNNMKVLKVISEYMEIHLTMPSSREIKNLPFQTISHGILSQKDLGELLDQTHLFIGLGEPLIGPGPFDALAYGCTFLQPIYAKPRNRDTDAAFAGKPTIFTHISQHGYLEQFGDPEYVYTVDYNDIDLVKETVERIAKREKLSPYIPYEFTGVGYMDRLAILTEKLQTCDTENVALNKVPQSADGNSFDANNILLLTDGVWSMHSCYSLVNLESKRPFVSIGFDSTVWVWEVKLRLSPTWNTERHNPLDNIDIELLSENGQLLKVRSFVVDRVSIEWLWVNTSDVAHVILYTNVNINICEFEVYSNEAYKQLWPSIDTLEVKHSKPGESCSTTCFTHDRICSRNFFSMLDTTEYFKQHFDCKGYRTDRIGPAIDDPHSFQQDCFQNTDPMQYNCIEKQDSVIRICPCVLKHPGQNGVPFTDGFN